MSKSIRILGPLAIGLAVAATAAAQTGAAGGEWRTYGGDLGHTRYAPLDQIDAGNFGDLEVAWRFKTDNLGPVPEYRFQSTPLVVDGVMYTTAGSRKAVVSLDAATGEMRWMYSLDEGARGGRGAAAVVRPRAGLLGGRRRAAPGRLCDSRLPADCPGRRDGPAGAGVRDPTAWWI